MHRAGCSSRKLETPFRGKINATCFDCVRALGNELGDQGDTGVKGAAGRKERVTFLPWGYTSRKEYP